ncbi:hypothetical protein [Arthrobacter mobilis]|uniref:Uncharacterized protein n=1 Tax=Arthrobacter mobilis TaxID=2724944 RepID=A0A7X6K752_9MICC|nr:hypothetical protein [Arthrobacter mobilis]NKX56392.1 hypothetical protein [Arthrobacter mobilis]
MKNGSEAAPAAYTLTAAQGGGFSQGASQRILAILGDGSLNASRREAEVAKHLESLDGATFRHHYYGFLTTAAAHRNQAEPLQEAVQQAVALNTEARAGKRRADLETPRQEARKRPLLQRILGR